MATPNYTILFPASTLNIKARNMLNNRNRPSLLGTPRPRDAAHGCRRTWRCRPGVEELGGRVLLAAGGFETWYSSSNPQLPFNYGAAGWVPVNIGNGVYAEVDTSGDNSVSYGNDIWYFSTNPTHPIAYGSAGWTPIGLGNGTYAAVDTSGDNSVSYGNDIWYFSTNPTHPIAYGSAAWVPVGFDNGTYAVVDTLGNLTTFPDEDVWYFSTNPSQPIAYGSAGWVPVGLSNGTYAAVDTSGNNSVSPRNDLWYFSTNPSQPMGYGTAGWVPIGFGSGYAAVDTSGGNGVAPTPLSSVNWSGYAVLTRADAVSNVRGEWHVPPVTGSGNTYSATWVGIDGLASGATTLEQTGTAQNIVNGVAQYYAWYEMVPNAPVVLSSSSYPVLPNDWMSANVSYTGSGLFLLDIHDFTQHWDYDTLQSLPSGSTASRSSAEWIEEAPTSPSGVAQLANFGTVTFSDMLTTISGGTLRVDTGYIDDQPNTDYVLNMNNNSGVIAATSQLNGAGNEFTVQYGSSTPAAPDTGPVVGYYGPMLRPSSVSGAASAHAPPSGISPIGNFVGVPRFVSPSRAADLPAQAALRPQASDVGRKRMFFAMVNTELGSQN